MIKQQQYMEKNSENKVAKTSSKQYVDSFKQRISFKSEQRKYNPVKTVRNKFFS